jgi:eukaryotic-like serine/threonine-protein kinase
MIIDTLKGQEDDNQYTNFNFLDNGGMGYVYTAHDNVNNHDVAVKLIAIPREEVEDLLSRELIVSEELASPYLVETHYCDKTTIHGNDYFYIVQKYYPEGNLIKRIKKDIPYDTCIKMFLDLLEGLKVLHTKVIHRDLKPGNILVNSDDTLLITDFGLAKFVGERTKTKSFKGAGTIPYKSPECWLMQDNQIQMDIYSLGIIFYQILTGELPFNGQTEQEWQDFHIYEQLPNIDNKRPGVPAKVKQIISKMTNKRAKERYANVDDIINAINQSIEQEKERNDAFERLAEKGHKKSEETKQTELKQQQELEKKEKFKKLVKMHIQELKERIKLQIKEYNSRVEDNHITFKDNGLTLRSTADKFSLNLNTMGAFFELFDYEAINEFEKYRIETSNMDQIRRHGGIIAQTSDSIFKQKNIVFLGKVSTNYFNPKINGTLGFNLVLVLEPGEIYADWYVASFYDTGFSGSSKKEYCLDLQEFLNEFPLCFVMHTVAVNYKKLEDSHIHRIIEELIEFS